MKGLFIILSLLLMFPVVTSAHTTVLSSIPTKGEEITGEVREFTIEFSSEIENQGSLTLVSDKKEIKLDTILIEAKKITGSLPTPLKNGNYTLTWKIAAKDGHMLTGDIPFSVNTTEEAVEKESIPIKNSENIQELKTKTVKDNRTPISTISVIILVILLALGIWILIRKKR